MFLAAAFAATHSGLAAIVDDALAAALLAAAIAGTGFAGGAVLVGACDAVVIAPLAEAVAAAGLSALAIVVGPWGADLAAGAFAPLAVAVDGAGQRRSVALVADAAIGLALTRAKIPAAGALLAILIALNDAGVGGAIKVTATVHLARMATAEAVARLAQAARSPRRKGHTRPSIGGVLQQALTVLQAALAALTVAVFVGEAGEAIEPLLEITGAIDLARVAASAVIDHHTALEVRVKLAEPHGLTEYAGGALGR